MVSGQGNETLNVQDLFRTTFIVLKTHNMPDCYLLLAICSCSICSKVMEPFSSCRGNRDLLVGCS